MMRCKGRHHRDLLWRYTTHRSMKSSYEIDRPERIAWSMVFPDPIPERIFLTELIPYFLVRKLVADRLIMYAV